MKCEKCGYTPNPGDQICINCGAKLSISSTLIPEVDIPKEEEKPKKDKKHLILIFTILGIIISIIVIFIVIKYLVL